MSGQMGVRSTLYLQKSGLHLDSPAPTTLSHAWIKYEGKELRWDEEGDRMEEKDFAVSL